MRKNNLLHIFFTVAIIFIPLFFWNGNLYRTGGDDSLLYYLIPEDFLSDYVSNLYSTNNPGSLPVYGTQAYQIPFLLLITTLKHIFRFTNTQLLCYGLNLGLGYLFFIFLCRELFSRKQKIEYEILIGLFYIFSNFSIYTLWNHQLFPLYLVSVTPLCIYLFLLALKKNSSIYILFLSIVISLFSILIMSTPWTLALIICIVPLIIFFAIKYKFVFAKYLLILLLLLILLNSYWLFHLVSSFFYKSTSNDIVRATLIENKTNLADDVILSVTSGNGILAPFFSQFHISVQKNNSWQYYEIFTNWGSYLLPFTAIFPVLFIINYVLYKKHKTETYIAFGMWMLATYFFTISVFGSSGVNIFLWLNKHIPGFNMFKNMFDKFGYSMALTSAFVFASSIGALDNIKQKFIRHFFVITLFAVLLLNATPFIFGEYYKFSIPTTNGIFGKIGGFNSDFTDLTNYLKNINDDSKILWLPLNIANYTPIADMNNNKYYYFGVSPIAFMANKNDLAGFNGLGKFGNILRAAITDRKYNEVGKILKTLNVNYIIVNYDVEKDFEYNYIYPNGLDKQLDDEFLKVILGEKMANFGQRYKLYKVNSEYRSERIEIIDEKSNLENILTIETISKYKYEIKTHDSKKNRTLVLREPYGNFWKLTINGLDSGEAYHREYMDYGNSWEIPANICLDKECISDSKGNVISLSLVFIPGIYDNTFRTISAITLIAIFITMANILLKGEYLKK